MKPPFLKNLIEWVTLVKRIKCDMANAFADHPTLVCSLSTGWSADVVGVNSAKALFGHVDVIRWGRDHGAASHSGVD